MLRIIVITLVALIGVFLLVRLLESQMVFFPSKYPSGFWSLQNGSDLKINDVWLAAGDGVKLHGWFAPHPQPVASLLMCHGNAGNVSDRYDWLEMLYQRVPVNLFIFDYRGYGRSESRPTEEGCYRDAAAAFDWLAAQNPNVPIIVHGHSLGSAVAVDLVHRLPNRAAGIILEAAFTNATDMARLMFGPIPMHWMSSMKWAADEKIAAVTIPKLFIHGEYDSIIPIRLGKKLFEAAAPPKEFVALSQADHNDTFVAGGDEYYQAIRDFVDRCVLTATGKL
jgi:hypothetical protein